MFSCSVMSNTAIPWAAACQASLSFTISNGYQIAVNWFRALERINCAGATNALGFQGNWNFLGTRAASYLPFILVQVVKSVLKLLSISIVSFLLLKSGLPRWLCQKYCVPKITGKEMQKGKMVVWGGLANSWEKKSQRQRRKGKIYSHLNAEFQRRARRDKKAFLSDQGKEIEENNWMGKTRDLFKKIRDTKGTFHGKMGSIKDRNGRDLP